MMIHTPVLLDEVLKTLDNISGKTIIDCTFGAGGYSRAFLAAGANVIAFDRDPSVISHAEKLTHEYGDRFTFINEPFSKIGSILSSPPVEGYGEAGGWSCTDLKSKTTPPFGHPSIGGELISAIVFDLGISSMQIDTPERGFSWRFDAPLDMRMGVSVGVSASELIQNSTAEELIRILKIYGDVKNAGAIARAMKDTLPTTTFELKELIYNPKDYGNVFQALRIAANDEMGEIEAAMNAVPEILAPDGICIAVTFHSLEDRLIKNIFREWTTTPGDARMPTVASAPFKLLKTYTPSDTEIQNNPRARSAHLRATKKI